MTIESCVLPEVHHYEKVVNVIEKRLLEMGYDKGLFMNYTPKLVNSFFDWDTDRYMDQRLDPNTDVSVETKRLKDTVAELHKDGVYITLDDYVELRHEYDEMRKAFSRKD